MNSKAIAVSHCASSGVHINAYSVLSRCSCSKLIKCEPQRVWKIQFFMSNHYYSSHRSLGHFTNTHAKKIGRIFFSRAVKIWGSLSFQRFLFPSRSLVPWERLSELIGNFFFIALFCPLASAAQSKICVIPLTLLLLVLLKVCRKNRGKKIR